MTHHEALYGWHSLFEHLSGDGTIPQLGEVKAFQIRVPHTLLSHPLREAVHPTPCRGTARELKIHKAILTWPGNAHICRSAGLAIRSLPHDDRTRHGITLWGTGEGSRYRFLTGDIHMLSLLCEYPLRMRHHGPGSASRRAMQVKMRKSYPHRGTIWIPRDIHEACQPHANEIRCLIRGIRAILPEGCNRDHDQRRIERGEIAISQAQRRHFPWRTRFDEKSRRWDQVVEESSVVCSGEIERDAALIGCICPPEQAALGMDLVLIEGTDTPCCIARGWLHLDDVSAQISQDFAT